MYRIARAHPKTEYRYKKMRQNGGNVRLLERNIDGDKLGFKL